MWGEGEEYSLVPKINPGNPVLGKGEAYFFKTQNNNRLRQPFMSSSNSGVGKTESHGTRDRN